MSSNSNSNTTKKGRQMIEIKRLEKLSNRQTTFSKRRAGLFKKASELCVLTGAEIGIVVVSPSNRFFSFGAPDLQTIIHRYLNQSDDKDAAKEVKVLNTDQENEEYEDLLKRLDEEKTITAQLKARNEKSKIFWWQEEKNIGEMGMAELEEYIKAIEELMKIVSLRGDAMFASATAN